MQLRQTPKKPASVVLNNGFICWILKKGLSIKSPTIPPITNIGLVSIPDSNENFKFELVTPEKFYENYRTIWKTSSSNFAVGQNGELSFLGPMPKRPERYNMTVSALLMNEKDIIATLDIDTVATVRGISKI